MPSDQAVAKAEAEADAMDATRAAQKEGRQRARDFAAQGEINARKKAGLYVGPDAEKPNPTTQAVAAATGAETPGDAVKRARRVGGNG